MQPQPHRSGHKWRRFLRHNRGVFFLVFVLIFILGFVVLLFWMMTSLRFANRS